MILKKYPTIDVHGETRDTVIYPINQFIKDNSIMGKTHIVIIHGIGKGILRKTIHELLKKNQYVKEIYIDGMNLGATEVLLNDSSKN